MYLICVVVLSVWSVGQTCEKITNSVCLYRLRVYRFAVLCDSRLI
jgi:hypothetical protein